jgi:hypothetical protein
MNRTQPEPQRGAPVTLAFDHVFICTSPGAPEADALTEAGFTEGPGNTHPGQGTACRRFFFRNAYLELLWVRDEAEARSPLTAPLRLWERWRGRADGHTCPFGIGLRAGGATAGGAEDTGSAPFPTWPYRPRYLPPGMTIPVATSSDALHEPLLFLLPFPRPRAADADGDGGVPLWRPHSAGVDTLTRVALAAPPATSSEPSVALTAVAAAGIVGRSGAADHVLVLGFDGEATDREVDFRPMLPLIVRW